MRRRAILNILSIAIVVINCCLSPFSTSTQAAALDQPMQTAPTVQILNNSVDYNFGQSLDFEFVLQSAIPVTQATIYFRAAGEPDTRLGDMMIAEFLPTQVYTLSYAYNLAQQPLRAFSIVTYHIEVQLENEETFTSPDYQFFYEDNRFKWQVKEEAPFILHWSTGDDAFAQGVLDVAQSGLKRVQTLLDLPVPGPVNIYVYNSATQMQETLTMRQNWMAGHADPDLGIMVVALPAGPEQRLLTEQRIPHELMHLMLYQSLGPAYQNLPVWLNEGLASVAELYPNPDYQLLLDNAYKNQRLLPMSSLCLTFPRDVSNALLAYAQAASFTRYLQNVFGAAGLKALVDTYANTGIDCEHGIENALGKSLSQLERQWRQEVFAENATLIAFSELSPWLVLMLMVLLAPISLTLVRIRHGVAHSTG